MNGERLPASYANFYIANGVVIVPTFNDVNDRIALDTLARVMPRTRSSASTPSIWSGDSARSTASRSRSRGRASRMGVIATSRTAW